MAQRIDALVHGGMSAEEAAEVIGIDPSALVQHGNGYAVVTSPPEELDDNSDAEVAETVLDAPEEDEDDG